MIFTRLKENRGTFLGECTQYSFLGRTVFTGSGLVQYVYWWILNRDAK